MGFWKRFKDFFTIYEEYEEEYIEDYTAPIEEPLHYYFEDTSDIYSDSIVGKVYTIQKGEIPTDFKYESKQLEEEQRKHCLKLYEIAKGFDDLDAATVMCVLCQTHMDVVLTAIADRCKDMDETLGKYKEISNE